VDNENPGAADFYKPSCETYGIDFEVFKTRFLSDEYRRKVRGDFSLAKRYGIKGFPSVVMEYQSLTYMVTPGFATFEKMRIEIERVMSHVAN
jgi:putative protein-disulfide isomerase